MPRQPHAVASFAPNPTVRPQNLPAGDFAPSETAQKLIEWSVAKAALPADRLVVLGLLAGVFIALGGAFFTGVMAELSLSHGPSRLLGGSPFPPGSCWSASPAPNCPPATA